MATPLGERHVGDPGTAVSFGHRNRPAGPALQETINRVEQVAGWTSL